MNQAVKILFVVIILMFSFTVKLHAATSGAQGFNFYMAAGPNFVIPTSVRLGWGRWEAGMLTRNFVGINKTFTAPNSSVYAGFGLGVNTDPFQKNLGVQASIGVNYQLIWGLGIRAEMLANANFNSSSMAHALVGVSYGF